MKRLGTGQTFLQQIIGAGRFFGLGRRQRRRIAGAIADCPTEPLIVEYRNGQVVRYIPKSVIGQLLVCDAYVKTPEVPQEVLESSIAISRYEFKAEGMRQLFDRYHAALMGDQVLRWESDGTNVSREDLQGEQLQIQPMAHPDQTRFEKPGRRTK